MVTGLWILLACGVLALVVAAVAWAGGVWWESGGRYSRDGWGFSVVAFVLGIAAATLLIITGAVGCSRHFDRQACYSWGQQTGRTVQWRAYAYGGLQWDCFVKTSDGRWLPKNQLRDLAP